MKITHLNPQFPLQFPIPISIPNPNPQSAIPRQVQAQDTEWVESDNLGFCNRAKESHDYSHDYSYCFIDYINTAHIL